MIYLIIYLWVAGTIPVHFASANLEDNAGKAFLVLMWPLWPVFLLIAKIFAGIKHICERL